MLAGTKKEDQDAMLAAQKQAAANAESAAKSSAASSAPAPVSNSWGSQSLGGGASSTSQSTFSPAPNWGPAGAEVTTGYGGKPAPVIPPFPER
jgi:membrane protein involved in colicin uptake